jgi:hypothetical protein
LLLLPAPAAADDREALKPLIEKALQAAGGEKAVAVRAWTVTETRVATEAGRESRSARRVWVQLPDLYRLEADRNEWVGDTQVRSVLVLRGEKGWRHVNVLGPTEELSPAQVASAREGVLFQLVAARAAALLTDPAFQPTALPATTVGDRAVAGVRLTHKVYPPVRLYFDRETGRLLWAERNAADEPALGRTAEITYSDHRNAGGGAWVPFKREYRAEGPKVTTSQVEGVGQITTTTHLSPVRRVDKVTEYKPADQLDPKLFEKP